MSTSRQNRVFGLHSVQALLEQSADQVIELMVSGGRRDRRIKMIIARAERQRIPVQELSRAQLDDMADGARHQGVIAIARAQQAATETDIEPLLAGLSEPAFLLVLDGVQDPHNLGACLRSADAAGVHAVIAPRDRAVGLTPVVRKVASGAAESVPFIQVANLSRTLKRLADLGLWIVGTTGEATDTLYDADLEGPVAVVMGAEGKGMRRLTKEHCQALVHIPMAGTVESLNVSVAAGVCLFEVRRRRLAAA